MEEKGLCLIFNYETFPDCIKRRFATKRDASLLKRIFESLNFVVHVFDNLNHQETINMMLEMVRKLNQVSFSSLTVCMLSHGGKEGIFCSDDKVLKTETFFDMFGPERCEGLIRKPKVFIINACRGGLDLPSYKEVAKDSLDDPVINSRRDFIFLYSTVEGHVSLRIPQEGSPFIISLYKAMETGKEVDLHDVFLRTNADINGQSFYGKDKSGKLVELRQGCESKSYLTKKLIYKRKEGHFLLAHIDNGSDVAKPVSPETVHNLIQF